MGNPDETDTELEEIRSVLRREAARTSERDVARRAGVSKGTISNFVHGRTAKPLPDQLVRLRAFAERARIAASGQGRPYGTSPPADSPGGSEGSGPSVDYWRGYWRSRQVTLHDTMGMVRELQDSVLAIQSRLAEMQDRAIAMHQEIMQNATLEPLTPQQLAEQLRGDQAAVDADRRLAHDQDGGDEASTPPQSPPGSASRRRRAGGSQG